MYCVVTQARMRSLRTERGGGSIPSNSAVENRVFAPSSSGRTLDFDSRKRGSNPRGASKNNQGIAQSGRVLHLE